MDEFNRVVEYVDSRRGLEVKLRVREATVYDSMKRAVLAGAASTWLEAYRAAQDGAGSTVADAALAYTVQALYPDLLAVTFEAEGLSLTMSITEFIDLPEKLVGAWSDAVYELNAHWLGLEDAETEEVKKVRQPGGKRRKRPSSTTTGPNKPLETPGT